MLLALTSVLKFVFNVLTDISFPREDVESVVELAGHVTQAIELNAYPAIQTLSCQMIHALDAILLV